MIIKQSINLIEILIDEVALEGLDGITLEALWQRLGIRLGDPLPLSDSFKDQIWKICIEIRGFTFYELEQPRDRLVIFDRYELEYLNLESDKEYEQKDIYLHCPIEDIKNGIRGSCANYTTRKSISEIVKDLTLIEANNKFGQKLIIVASQLLRERALIEDCCSPNMQLPLSHYCLLERIGRARTIGEVTLKRTSNIKEDARSLFYIRKGLQDHGLIRKQVYYQTNTGLNYNGQNMGTLVHLTRFFNTRKPKVIQWAEHLINYLKSKENYAAEYSEVKRELNLDYSVKKFFKINLLQKVFRTDLKVPYRSYYPNSVEKEWQVKNNTTKERIIKLVTLSDPNIEISDLWRTEEVKEDDDHFQIDIKNQKFHVPFLKQIYEVVESKEFKGASQTELASELGCTKLIGRTLVRNLVKTKCVTTYLDDVGRQRTTKFVSKKFNAKSSLKKQFDEEISKIKEYNLSLKNEKTNPVLNSNKNKQSDCKNNIINDELEKPIDDRNSLPDNDANTENYKNQLFSKVNSILLKYKLFKNAKRYKYTKLKKLKKISCAENTTEDTTNKEINKVHTINGKEKSESNKTNIIIESDFYKTIEAKLIVQKPECKKKSQKMAVVGFMENVHNFDKNQFAISYRLLRRANMIIECVKQHKIIEDTQKLMKYINAEEDKEGLAVKIDKNSLIRLLQKLTEDNFIKFIKLILKNKKLTKQKVVNFICDPSIDVNNTVIQSAVEQAKLKFCMMETQSHRQNMTNTRHNPATSTRISRNALQGKIIIRRNNRLGKKYGYCPKFIRMKSLHIFLYYLIYDHPEKEVPKTIFLANLKKEEISNDAIFENVKVYNAEINWKTFIPPLPKHRGYPPGWALMCDIHLRMPLALFVKVHNVNFEVPGLQELLDHPIKRYLLVKDLPATVRNLLFLKRKYMFSIHEIVTRLCYLGLVQLGPQMLKEKDQVFIYLNRNTELLDTTSSAAGYHKVEDKPYPVTKFNFHSMAIVENYWYEMWNTCINTCLGGRSVVEGKDILLEDLSRKTEMIRALKAKASEEAVLCDTGFVPGDRKGAAGIDSAFFPHLKRNWNWMTIGQKELEKKDNRRMASVKVAKTNRLSNSQARKTTQGKRRSSPLKQGHGKVNDIIDVKNNKDSQKQLIKLKHEKGQVGVEFPIVACGKPTKIIRKVLPRKPMRKRVKYDEIDFSALQRMDKLRVDWEQHEDNILLVCKVAMVYLCPNPRRTLVTFTAIRDILRSYSFTSCNKTSRACQRRLLYMLKQPKTVNSVLLGVEEIKQDYFVNKRFGNLVDTVRGDNESPADYEKRVEKNFKDLVSYIAKKYYNISNMEQRDPLALPKTVQEFNLFYKLKLPTKTMTSPGVSKEVREVNDIHTATINSVIHSSMCCGKERRSWAYQLFKVYQQYPEYLLRSAMMKIRADQMVTMKKNYMCAYKKFGNCMPMSSSQYQLSSAYYYKFQTKWPYEVFSESYSILLALLENYTEKLTKEINGVEVKPGDGGIVAAVHDFISTDNMDIDIEIPDQIIMLDPGLPEKDDVYQRIALRYQTILDGLSSDYTDQLKNSISNNLNSENLISKTDSDSIEQISINNEQQKFVEIRLAKRPIEHDYCTTQSKKQKLNEEDKSVNEGYSKTSAFKKNVQFYNHNLCTEIQNYSNHSENNVPLISYENESLKSSELFKNNLNNEIIPPATSDSDIEINSQPICNSNNVNKSENIEIVGGEHTCRTPQIGDSIVDKDSVQSSTNSTIDVIMTSDIATSENEGAKTTFIRVKDIIKNVDNQDIVEDVATRTDIHDVRTRQTRIAMLKMREELHDLTFHDSHHAHEYFVVNSFKLLYSLMVNEEDNKNVTVYRGKEVPKVLLPSDVEIANKVLDDIKKFAIFPKNSISYNDFKKQIMELKQYEWSDVDEICQFIKNRTEFGATLYELVANFNHLKNKLDSILLLLSEKRIVLRAGIVTVRYIYHRYVNPWIIHSYKILRLEKESHQTVPEGTVYVLDNEDSIIDKEKEAKRVTTAANLFYNSNNQNVEPDVTLDKKLFLDSTEERDEILTHLEPDQNDKVSNEIKNLEDNNAQKPEVEDSTDARQSPTNQKRLRRNRTVLLKQKDIYRAAKLLDFNTAEEIKVVIKPWIRIDGVLNRRVLDRMLGAVLCYCIEKPGISLTAIQNRFTPAIQPYHTRELIEILVKLDCLKMLVQVVPKVTLFTKPRKLNLNGNPALVADSDTIIIQPSVQATLRFGMFLSNRSYSLDFLSSL